MIDNTTINFSIHDSDNAANLLKLVSDCKH